MKSLTLFHEEEDLTTFPLLPILPLIDTPFSVFRLENFVVSTSVKSNITNEILIECKDDDFYRSVCDYLDNNNLPIPHPKIEHF